MARSIKTEFRHRAEANVATLPRGSRPAADEAVAERLVALPEWAGAKTVLLYAAMPDEVATLPLIRRALEEDKRVALPACDMSRHAIVAREVREPERDLLPGAYGIYEPEFGCPAVPVDEIDLVLVPGRAFDAAGRRVGRGGGYYDRLLAGFRGRTVALAFDCQVFREVPADAHDIAVGAVVTESRTIRPGT